MRCVILGGGGFLGRHVGAAMSAAGHEVWSVDHDTSADREVPWLAGHFFGAFTDVEAWVERCGAPDVVVHLASSTVPATASRDPAADARINLVATLDLLMGLRALPVTPRLLFASSGGAVYGQPQTIPLTETHPTAPIGAYGVTKLATEHYLRVEEILNGLQVRILRVSNPFGEWQRPHGAQGVISVFAHNALHHRPVDVWGDGSVVRDFVYAGDVGRAFVAAAIHDGPSRVFNVGGGRGITIGEIIKRLEKVVGHEIERREHPARPFDPQVNVLDISLAEHELAWAPKTSFEGGLRRLVDWLRTIP